VSNGRFVGAEQGRNTRILNAIYKAAITVYFERTYNTEDRLVKIFLKKDYLKKVTNEEQDLLETEDMVLHKERIQGMIDNNIHFCSLITGYRGTGKSAFVEYVLRKYKMDSHKNVLVININAAHYSKYETFIKRFIRELFLAHGSDANISESLKELYYHTFFDIKRSSLYSVTEKASEKMEISDLKKVSILSENDLNKAKKYLLKYVALIILTIISVMMRSYLFFKIVSAALLFILLIFFFLDLKVNFIKEKQKITIDEKEDAENKEKQIAYESLYDEEIAEFHLFNQLSEIKKKNKKVIFVLDELDKIEKEEELEAIFHDLKPLLLSTKCDFILVGGKNLEEYLAKKCKEKDAIAASIFSNRIYIPLSTIADMREFAEQFYEKESIDGFEESEVWKYFDGKIYEAKGIKRCFINGVLSDLKWEDTRPYVDMPSQDSEREYSKILRVCEILEQYVSENYDAQMGDELIFLLYTWLNKILNQPQQGISKKVLVDRELESGIDEMFSIEELDGFCKLFLDAMAENKLIKKTEGGDYVWGFNVMNEPQITDGVKHEIQEKEDFRELAQFVEKAKRLENSVCFFAEFNKIKISKKKYEGIEMIQAGEQRHEILFGTNNKLRNDFIKSQEYLRRAYLDGIGIDAMDFVKRFNSDMRTKKVEYVEQFLRFTYQNLLNFEIEEEGHGREYTQKFDIVCKIPNRNAFLITEVKYYYEYRQAIRTSNVRMLRDMIQSSKYVVMGKDIVLIYAIFTHDVSEKGYLKFKEKWNNTIKESGLDIRCEVYLLDLNNYVYFADEMEKLLNQI